MLSMSTLKAVFAGRYHKHLEIALQGPQGQPGPQGEPGLPPDVMSFQGFRDGSTNSVSPGVWTPIAYWYEVVNRNGANWLNDRHEIRSNQYGLWLYEMGWGEVSNPISNQFVGLWSGYPTLSTIHHVVNMPNNIHCRSTFLLFIDTDLDVVPVALSGDGTNFGVTQYVTYFRGVRLATV